MKAVVISLNDPNIYPGLHHLAKALVRAGADVHFLSSLEPTGVDPDREIPWAAIPKLKGVIEKIPALRANYHGIFRLIRNARPDWIIAQHEYLLPALAYKAVDRRVKVAGYFSDYYKGLWHTEVLKRGAGFLNAYVDICDVRLQWRQNDWSKIPAETFIIRQAPLRRSSNKLESHECTARVVLTGSNLLLKMNRERLSRFLHQLCSRDIAVDWYLPGPDDMREDARLLTLHPLFAVREPISKSELIETLSNYDAGLFWAPMADADLSRPWDRSVFVSAASNKIGEYIAAGLIVAHTGNPGLSYLPDDICVVFDPTDPEAGADQLVAQIADRAAVDRKRQAALCYHLNEMNFEAQAAPFINYVMEGAAAQPE